MIFHSPCSLITSREDKNNVSFCPTLLPGLRFLLRGFHRQLLGDEVQLFPFQNVAIRTADLAGARGNAGEQLALREQFCQLRVELVLAVADLEDLGATLADDAVQRSLVDDAWQRRAGKTNLFAVVVARRTTRSWRSCGDGGGSAPTFTDSLAVSGSA